MTAISDDDDDDYDYAMSTRSAEAWVLLKHE